MVRKSLVAVVVLAAIFPLLMYPKVHVLRGSAGGALYWNANEALLFMSAGITGARVSYLRYALSLF
jgi:hypothetical protein